MGIEKKCWNCKHNKSIHDGISLDELCAKDCMIMDGRFDWEYHKFKEPVECPLWENRYMYGDMPEDRLTYFNVQMRKTEYGTTLFDVINGDYLVALPDQFDANKVCQMINRIIQDYELVGCKKK